jgi:carbonic anhydrase
MILLMASDAPRFGTDKARRDPFSLDFASKWTTCDEHNQKNVRRSNMRFKIHPAAWPLLLTSPPRYGSVHFYRRVKNLRHLFDNNKAWAARIREQDPVFFLKLSQQQSPGHLWIGCSDSRVPANQIVGLLPGELFVHRNIANLVVHTDLNCLSVMQFAVDILKVRHVIVCGHYGCSGVQAALRGDRIGLSDNWLRHVQDVREKHEKKLAKIAGDTACSNRLCELNVIEQVLNVCQTTIARDAWERGQELTVHGWIYGLQDGQLHDLNMTVMSFQETPEVYGAAIAALK